MYGLVLMKKNNPEDHIKALLEVNGIVSNQDIAAFGMFLSVVMSYQRALGIDDDKMRRFNMVTADWFEMCLNELKDK